MSRVAIMQPTFLPWLGYFALIDLADDFVFLDNVQISRQSWQTRNRILGPHGPIMLPLPIPHNPSRPLIVDTQLVTGKPVEKLKNTLKGILGRSDYWSEVEPHLSRTFAEANDGLSAVNRTFIQSVCAMTGIEARFHLASELDFSSEPSSGKADNLLRICRRFAAREYLSPSGAYAYLREHNPFRGSGISLRFLNYNHPVYPQPYGSFVSHMSTVEALAYVGPASLSALVRAGVRPSLSFEDLEKSCDKTL